MISRVLATSSGSNGGRGWGRQWRRDTRLAGAMSSANSERPTSGGMPPTAVATVDDVEATFRTRIAAINECVGGASARADSRAATPRSSSPNVLSVRWLWVGQCTSRCPRHRRKHI